MSTNRTPINRGTKSRITPEALTAYKRARALYDKPIPADPEARDQQQRAYLEACVALHHLLGRALWLEDIMDTIGEEAPPMRVDRAEPWRVSDWQKAAAIRRELERLAKDQG
jgi:hypothetical protein